MVLRTVLPFQARDVGVADVQGSPYRRDVIRPIHGLAELRLLIDMSLQLILFQELLYMRIDFLFSHATTGYQLLPDPLDPLVFGLLNLFICSLNLNPFLIDERISHTIFERHTRHIIHYTH